MNKRALSPESKYGLSFKINHCNSLCQEMRKENLYDFQNIFIKYLTVVNSFL